MRTELIYSSVRFGFALRDRPPSNTSLSVCSFFNRFRYALLFTIFICSARNENDDVDDDLQILTIADYPTYHCIWSDKWIVEPVHWIWSRVWWQQRRKSTELGRRPYAFRREFVGGCFRSSSTTGPHRYWCYRIRCWWASTYLWHTILSRMYCERALSITTFHNVIVPMEMHYTSAILVRLHCFHFWCSLNW